ncbi:MAG: polysaccharide biosynthesis protein [Firmicutes bacterium]|nr:polysaccharide biosynthesis protein [Bacillota bacterium]
MKQEKKSFMINVSIVMFSQIAVKLLGMVYRVVITNFRGFGDLGNGYLNVGFQIYTLLLAISSIGIPNAVSKLTSEKVAVRDYAGAHRIFRAAMLLFAIIGTVSSAILYFGAGFISKYIVHLDDTRYVLMCLAPSVLFVCLSSVIRGYFVGMENMHATSTSQVLEQFFKCTLTILIVYLLASFPAILTVLFDISEKDENARAVFMASGAQVATTLSTVIGFLYLLLFYLRRKKQIFENINPQDLKKCQNLKHLFKKILFISVPISLGSVISAINRIIDTATITRGIEAAFRAVIPAHGSIAAIYSPTLSQLSKEAARLSGLLAKSDTLINLPLALNISFSTVLVPAIAGALALKDKKGASEKVNYSLLISILIALPCAVGYITLASPIYGLLYPNARLGYDLLQISAVAMIFTALNQTLSGSLQGVGKVFAPATGLLIGCLAKLILNIILIRQPKINIYGAPISSVVCQIIAFSYSFNILKNHISVKIDLRKHIVKPLICALAMGAAAYISYNAFMLILRSNMISVCISIVISAGVYFVSVVLLKILSDSEILMLPMGNKLYKFLLKRGIYK